MSEQEIADVKMALVRVAKFSALPRPTRLIMDVLVPCAREHESNADWGATCDRLSALGVLTPIERDIWYTVI